MIIGFAGRAHSGKTELAKISEKYGFIRLYFALPLKQLIADLLDITIDEVNKLKTASNEYILSVDKIHFLSDKTNIQYDWLFEKLNNKIFHNTRELLQIIGTDIIRTQNPNWHVDQIRQMIDYKNNYVIDDVRFPNEVDMIKEIGGVLFFVIRPNLEHVSNHISETSLKWQDFDNLIINDKNLDNLTFKWDTFMKNGFSTSLLKRVQLLNKLLLDPNLMSDFMKPNNTLSMFDMYFIHKCQFDYNPKYSINNDNIEKLENFNNTLFRVYTNDNNVEIITNPLMIEDLKLFYNNV